MKASTLSGLLAVLASPVAAQTQSSSNIGSSTSSILSGLRTSISASAGGTGSSTSAGNTTSRAATSPSASASSSVTRYTPSATDDLGWIPTASPPTITPLETTLENLQPGTATTPVPTTSVDFNGDYSSQRLEQLWEDFVGDVLEPPLNVTPHPPQPYPLPEAPPPLFPPEYTICPKNILPGYKFPSDFLFGWSSSAVQWEGATKADGKGPSVWDWASRYAGYIGDNSTADVADLGYYLYEEGKLRLNAPQIQLTVVDLARLAALGGNAFGFSLFWTRIYPFGGADTPVNQQGLDHYQDVIDYAWSQGVEPVVTLFHWDTPLALQLEYGGFSNERIIDDFVNYAETVFKAYNGSVHKWITFNEPNVFCGRHSDPVGSTIPDTFNATTYLYTCSQYIILAHAKTYHRFKELGIVGELSIKLNGNVGQPWRKDNWEDIVAVNRSEIFSVGTYAVPIYQTGDWPELMKEDMPSDILPRFTDDQVAMIRGTADFFAIDSYTAGFVGAPEGGIDACRANSSAPGWPACTQGYQYYSGPDAWALGPPAAADVTWLFNSWPNLRGNLKGLADRYPTPGGLYLTEFGFAEPGENEKSLIYQITEDTSRTAYFMSYLTEILKGICEDGTPIKGLLAWAITDNFEWDSGYADRFGVQYVDYNSPTLKRTFKRSAMEMSQFWQSHRCENGQ